MSLVRSVSPVHSYSLRHLSNETLLSDLTAIVIRDRATTAEMLAHIAEVDWRKLYRPAGFPSMHAYCLGELHLSEEAASKRIHAARFAREFPAAFAAVADGRLHLSALVLLAPKLKGATQETAGELIVASTHKSKAEIEVLLAHRFPQPDVTTRVQAIEPPPESIPFSDEHAPGRVENELQRKDASVPPPKVKPLAPERFALQVTISQNTHDTLREVQALLSHRIPSGDIAAVLDLALNELKNKLEKRKFGATNKPRAGRKRSKDGSRHIPAHVRRAVRERDQDRCTFVSESGRRCEARMFLQFDHVEEFARGGEASVVGVRLRCAAHNQFTAEQTFGEGFMSRKREEAQLRAAERREKKVAEDRAAAIAEDRGADMARAKADAERARELDVVPWLKRLGFRAEEAKEAARLCETIPDAPLEERVRRALSFLQPRGTVRVPASA